MRTLIARLRRWLFGDHTYARGYSEAAAACEGMDSAYVCSMLAASSGALDQNEFDRGWQAYCRAELWARGYIVDVDVEHITMGRWPSESASRR